MRRWLKRSLLILLGFFLVWSLWLAGQLYRHAHQPTDALLVLGGSIQRETHAAQLSKTLPDVPILISGGSQLPCIALVFEREQASLEQVYSDRCAQGTWGNFYHSTPILRSWSAHHVRLITSASHLPRALWMGRLYLGIHGIWVEADVVTEKGIPGNTERWWKTLLDLGRTVPAAIWSLREPPTPHCPLQTVPSTQDLARWGKVFSRGRIHCEHQGGLDKAIDQLRQAVEQYHRLDQDLK